MALLGTSGCTNLDKDLGTEDSRRLSVALSMPMLCSEVHAPSFSRSWANKFW